MGSSVGRSVGSSVGKLVGSSVGKTDGSSVGKLDGSSLGKRVGSSVVSNPIATLDVSRWPPLRKCPEMLTKINIISIS